MENFNFAEFYASLPYKRIISFVIVFILIFFSFFSAKYNLFGEPLESKKERVFNKRLSRKTKYKLSGSVIIALINLLFVLISLGIGFYYYNKSK
jgi:hypothetical protein